MNKFQKELLQESLKSERKILSDLRKTYEQAEKDIDERLQALLARFNATDDANLQRTIIYQMDYQKALKQQVSGILDSLNGRQFESISDYIQKSYEDAFIGTLYDLQGQGVPLIFPIDQEQVTTAIAKNTKLSKSLYSALGEDVADLKKRVQNELSRGIAQNLSYAQIAKNIKNQTTIGYNRAARISRTEGHRVQQAAQADAQLKAKEAGADVVKQWDATLDGRTRNAHRTLDGQVRELDEPFEINGNKAMYPGNFGIPSQDIHCRCVILTRARLAVDDETGATKFDNETGQLVEIESKNYQDFKKKYFETLDEIVREEHNIMAQHSQFGKKIGKHAQDFGLDPKKELDRKKMANIISRIKVEAEEIRIGEWRGQEDEVLFYIKGKNVVVTRQDGAFVSILKGGISNERVKNARIK